VLLSRFQILTKLTVNVGATWGVARHQFEGIEEAGHHLHPENEVILMLGGFQAQFKSFFADVSNHKIDQNENYNGQNDENGVIQGQKHETEQQLKGSGTEIHEQLLHSFLDGNDVEKAIHQFGNVLFGDFFKLEAGESVDEVKGSAHHDVFSDVLTGDELHDVHPAAEEQAAHHQKYQHIDGGRQLTGHQELNDCLKSER